MSRPPVAWTEAVGHYQAGRLVEAEAACRRVLAQVADQPEALGLLAVAMQQQGRAAEAERLFARLTVLQPKQARAWNNLANNQAEQGKREAAVESYRRALALQPDYPVALKNLGQTLRELGRLSEAVGCYQQALALDPTYAEAHLNLGIALSGFGNLTGAYASFERALALKPDSTAAHSNLIYTLDLMPGAGFAEQQAERGRWWRRHAQQFAPAAGTAYANVPDPERALRIGYVSADFRRHSAAYCFGPVLQRHDRERFTVVCYSGVTIEDDVTRELRRCADVWCPTGGMSDEALADRVRADRIDILVDLSSHTNGNRLLVFARKPAPVQVTAWGYATGTGLPTIDYLFADTVMIPDQVRGLFAEEIFDLPCVITMEPPNETLDVGVLPALHRGRITFGCFNRLSKVTPECLTLWARILERLPDAHFIMKDSLLGDQAARQYVADNLGRHGVDPSRVELRGGTPRLEHLQALQDVDIAFDPFPHNGGISTYEALWMGVPVITLQGGSPTGRVTAAILTAVGLHDWVADNEEAYIQLAIDRASDVTGLAGLRSNLRRRIANSAAGNPDQYTRAVEDAYRTIWRRWCQEQTR